jgi:hypothetical protein
VPARMWADFPAGVPRPTGPINLIDGPAYDAARRAADQMNGVLRRHGVKYYGNPLKGMDIHEIVPVKFGGSPTALANKHPLLRSVHRQNVSPWFERLKQMIERVD